MRITQLITSIGALAFIAATQPAVLRAQAPQDRLWDAAIRGDTAAIAVALKEGARIDSLDTRSNPNGRMALNWAAWYDHPAAISYLIAHGAQVNLANRTGFTPLHHAAEHGSLAAARALLGAGADPTATNAQGLTPLEVARERGHVTVAAALDSASRPAGPR